MDTEAEGETEIARIDNRIGRRVLPSVQKLADLVTCMWEQTPTAPITPTTPTPVPLQYPRICAINWPHGGDIQSSEAATSNVPWTAFINHLKDYGLIIVFDRPVLANTLNRHTVQLLYSPFPQGYGGFDVRIFAEIEGEVIPIHVDSGWGIGITRGSVMCNQILWQPYIERLDGDEAQAVQFMPKRDQGGLWPAGMYRVVLRGDAILGAATIQIGDEAVHPALDGNHLGPGLKWQDWITIPGRLANPRQYTGNGTEGGTFESWFTIDGGTKTMGPSDAPDVPVSSGETPPAQPPDVPGTAGEPPPTQPPDQPESGVRPAPGNRLDVNSTLRRDLRTAVGDELADRIVAARDEKPFTSKTDFQKRLKPDAETWNAIKDLIVVRRRR